MKIILIIPFVLHFLDVADVVDAADNHLRGSNRDLQFGQFDFGSVGDNSPFAALTSTNPTQPSLQFQIPGQLSEPNSNAPVLGSNIFTFPSNPINPGFLQPTDPADTSIFGGFGSGEDFDFGSFFSGGSQPGLGFGGGDEIVPSPIFLGPPLQAPPPDSGAGDPPPNLPPGLGGGQGSDDSTGSSGCRRSESVCILVFDPVICEGGCRYGNSCEASGAGFAVNQCRPD